MLSLDEGLIYPSVTSTQPSKGSSESKTPEPFDSKLQLFNQHQPHSTPDSTCEAMKNVTEQINSFFMPFINGSLCELNDCNEIDCTTDEVIWKIILQCSPQIGIEMILINISRGDQGSQFFNESGTFFDTFNVTVDIVDSKTMGFGIDVSDIPIVNYTLIPLDSCGVPSTHSHTTGPSESSTIQPTLSTTPTPTSVPISFDSTCDAMRNITEEINSFFMFFTNDTFCELKDCNEINCTTDEVILEIILQCSPQIGIEMILINISRGDQESQFFTESGTFFDTFNVTVDIMDSTTMGFGIDIHTDFPIVNYTLIPLDSCGVPSTHSHTTGPSESSTIEQMPATTPVTAQGSSESSTIQPKLSTTLVPTPTPVPIPFDSTCDAMKNVTEQINSFFMPGS